ncbi:Rhodanese-like domain [Serratia rubidaea]|nr:Rhodanese-like domain [Serratia rubidaea]
MSAFVYRDFSTLRAALLARQELALIDVREEAEFAQSHPLFAVNIPLSKLELEAYRRIPHRGTPITVYDNGDGRPNRRQRGYGSSAMATSLCWPAVWRAGKPVAASFSRTSIRQARPLASWWKAAGIRHR